MKIIFTALFSLYEELKEPAVITPNWRYICFTDQPIKSDVWEVIQVCAPDSRRKARELKILPPDWISAVDNIWVDASFKINCNLTGFWNRHFDKDFSAPKHPWRSDVYQEITDCIVCGRGEERLLKQQAIDYHKRGVPANNGIIQSGILLRRHTPEVIELCNRWWHELSAGSTRDQVAFAAASIGFDYTVFKYHYCHDKDFIYHHHYQRRFGNRYDEMIKNV